MRIILLTLIIFSSPAWADEVKNLSELALLPKYCRGTQFLRDLSKDPTPIKEYEAIYGHAYTHLHHYCWALNAENNARKLHGGAREGKLINSLGDFKYIIDLAPPDFSLLPEIYTSRARVLFSLKRDIEAVSDLIKAIGLKPSYSHAYVQLSDYYQRLGDKNNAIKILEQGLNNTQNANNVAFFIKKLEKLGHVYQGTPSIPLKEKDESAHSKNPDDITEKNEDAANSQASTPEDVPLPATSSTENPTLDSAEKNSATDQATKSYCRFCP